MQRIPPVTALSAVTFTVLCTIFALRWADDDRQTIAEASTSLKVGQSVADRLDQKLRPEVELQRADLEVAVTDLKAANAFLLATSAKLDSVADNRSMNQKIGTALLIGACLFAYSLSAAMISRSTSIAGSRSLLWGFLRSGALLELGIRLPRGEKKEIRDEAITICRVTHWHLHESVRMLDELSRRAPLCQGSDAEMAQLLLHALIRAYTHYGLEPLDPRETEWSQLFNAERQFEKLQASERLALAQERQRLEEEVARRLKLALAEVDLKSRDAAKLANEAEERARKRHAEASLQEDQVAKARREVDQLRTSALEAQQQSEVNRNAALRDRERAESDRQAAIAEREATLALVNEHRALVEYSVDRLIQVLDSDANAAKQIRDVLRAYADA